MYHMSVVVLAALGMLLSGVLMLWLFRRIVTTKGGEGGPSKVPSRSECVACWAHTQRFPATMSASSTSSVWISESIEESRLIRKREWVAQRGEAFLRKLMMGNRARGDCCSRCGRGIAQFDAEQIEKKFDSATSENSIANILTDVDMQLERRQASAREVVLRHT